MFYANLKALLEQEISCIKRKVCPISSSSIPPVQPASRLELLDTIRGLTLISMILYHACWDLVYLHGAGKGFTLWYQSFSAFLWQQSICWTFILLSGFCAPLSRHALRRSLSVFLSGALVTAVTLIVTPESRVIFGILTFLGSAGIATALLRAACRKIRRKAAPHSPGESLPALLAALCLSFWLFLAFLNIQSGVLRILPGITLPLPASLYHGYPATFFGFQGPSFWSTDYFPFFPWYFLYLTGYWLSRLLSAAGLLSGRHRILHAGLPALSWLGRHSLPLYLIHQPILYGIFLLV